MYVRRKLTSARISGGISPSKASNKAVKAAFVGANTVTCSSAGDGADAARAARNASPSSDSCKCNVNWYLPGFRSSSCAVSRYSTLFGELTDNRLYAYTSHVWLKIADSLERWLVLHIHMQDVAACCCCNSCTESGPVQNLGAACCATAAPPTAPCHTQR